MIYTFTNAIDAQEYYLRKRDNMYCHLNYENGRYIIHHKQGIAASNKVLKIEPLERTDYEEYVYDIETEDGTFQAGVGCMILKNTDSIYTQFSLPNQEKMSDDEKLEKIFKVSTECANRISNTFKKPIELEMEKVMYPCLLFSKKRYVNRYFERNKKGETVCSGIDAKGIQIVRRDNCKLVKKISNPVLEKIMYDKDINGAMEIARSKINDLLQGKIPIEDLTITKSLKSHYNDVDKNGRVISKPAHWHLAQKMKERDPMTAPKAGDRVPYVFIENDDKGAQQKDKVEDPEYVKENTKKCKPDVLYYLDRQIRSPLETLFSVLVRNKEGQLFPYTEKGEISKDCKKEIARLLWDNAKRKKENTKKGQREISHWFKIQ